LAIGTIGIENLSINGVLGFITMNSFYKSLNGRALRDYFQKLSLNFRIIDFGAEQIFKSKNTYTCICLIEKRNSPFIEYSKCENPKRLSEIKIFSQILYNGLDSKKGWNLQDNEIISKIESTGIAFGDIYKTRHGIGTLRNDIYIFNPVREDKDYYYLQNGNIYQIEKGVCKDIVNSNKLSRPANLNSLKEKVIFPYDDNNKPKLLGEKLFKSKFPKAYNYLESKRVLLAKRDKGKGEYENWFTFGRTQSLEKMKNKLFFPKMADQTPSYIINGDENLLFYNGLAIVGGTKKELAVIKKIMNQVYFGITLKRLVNHIPQATIL
jgi:adenine-specific DNA-methyltransferase